MNTECNSTSGRCECTAGTSEYGGTCYKGRSIVPQGMVERVIKVGRLYPQGMVERVIKVDRLYLREWWNVL